MCIYLNHALSQIHWSTEIKAAVKGKTIGYVSFYLPFSVGSYFNAARVHLFA